MKTWIRSSLSVVLGCAVLSTALLPLGAAAASGLSPVQAALVASQIAKLQHVEERSLASQWSDAKKAAEFICRPMAMSVLQRELKTADRVFLGTDDPATLNLVSDSLLKGSGQVRTNDGWRTFNFSCALDPQTGKAVSFQPSFTS
jgi:hypothetical protein